MASYEYTGRLTNAQRATFLESRHAALFVKPQRPGIGATGLIHDYRIPVTVDLNNGGHFSVWLEASGSVTPPMLYDLICEWLQDGVKQWTVWASFHADVGGGSIADMRTGPLLAPGITHGYGPPQPHDTSTTAYIDRSGKYPVLYLPEGNRI